MKSGNSPHCLNKFEHMIFVPVPQVQKESEKVKIGGGKMELEEQPSSLHDRFVPNQ